MSARLPVLALTFLGGVALAAEPSAAPPGGGDDTPLRLLDPFPFDHAVHEAALRAARVTCVDCHPIGLVVADAQPTTLPIPRSSCHACHRAEIPRTPRGAPSVCATCHADLEALEPESHHEGWRTEHAGEARALSADCADCHTTTWCFACHDDRGPLSEDPHGPGFRVTHGVEARLDAHACTTCHTGKACVACHETRSLPW